MNPKIFVLILFLVCGVALLLFGCGQMQFRVTHKSNPNYDFSKIKSYEIVKNRQDKIENLPFDESWLQNTVIASLRDSLDNKGLKEDLEQANVVVSYYIVVEKTVDTVVIDSYYNNYYQYSPYPTTAMPAHRKVAYDKGTLVIDVVDKKYKQFVWRGAADTVVRGKGDKEQAEKNIRKAVDEIFKQLPR